VFFGRDDGLTAAFVSAISAAPAPLQSGFSRRVGCSRLALEFSRNVTHSRATWPEAAGRFAPIVMRHEVPWRRACTEPARRQRGRGDEHVPLGITRARTTVQLTRRSALPCSLGGGLDCGARSVEFRDVPQHRKQRLAIGTALVGLAKQLRRRERPRARWMLLYPALRPNRVFRR